MKRSIFFIVVLAAAMVFTTGCGGKKAGEPTAAEEIGTVSETRAEGIAPPAAEPAEDDPSGPLGDWPEAFIDELKAAEGIRIYDRLPDNSIKALIKTPKDLREKGLEKDAELEPVPNRVALITLMNGWMTPDKWKESRIMAAAALEALAMLQDLAKDPDRADRASVVREAIRILKPADISEADLRRVYENQAALAKAVKVPK